MSNVPNRGAASSRGNSPSNAPYSGDDPINLRLKQKQSGPKLIIRPRPYQVELYCKTLDENVIIYLGTGLGKTFITVLFLESNFISDQILANKKVVFLAPTQDLVKQQAEYINKLVRYRVKIFCGRTARCGEHIDHWSRAAWDEELNKVEILFMTPQIFSAAISTNHLDWTKFAAIIFDEAHHAHRGRKKKETGHPYMQILKSYQAYYSYRHDESLYPKPRLIGLTASLINSMPKDKDDIRSEIFFLEKLFSAKCITNIHVQDVKPTIDLQLYTSFTVDDLLINMFKSFIDAMEEALKLDKIKKLMSMKSYTLSQGDQKMLAFHNRLKLAAMGFSIKPSSFPKLFQGLVMIRSNDGLWMLRDVCFKLVEAVRKHRDNPFMQKDMVSLYADVGSTLEKIYVTLDHILNQQPDRGLFSYTRPKPKALLDVLEREYKRTKGVRDDKNRTPPFSCIIFVQSRLEVVALNHWLQKVSSEVERYNFIRSDYAIGLAATMSSKYSCITKRKAIEQYRMLKDFRENVLNTIVTTSVLEEGIDLPVCSTVIRYDAALSFRPYVQSRGRARQDISSYITLCRIDDCDKEEDRINKFHDFEKTLKEKLCDKDIASISRNSVPVREVPLEEEEDFFLCKDNSIRITASTAKTILNMYCTRLAQKTPFTEGIRYERMTPIEHHFQTTLYLPSGCPLNEGIRGGIKVEAELADNSAIVATVKALYEAKELNEYGAPTRVTEANIDDLLASKGLNPKFDQLEPSQAGECVQLDNGKQIFLYEPALRRASNLLTDCADRVYKLIRIAFVSHDDDVTRQETKVFFEKSVFGIIVDSSASLEFIPPLIYGHYGNFRVNFKEVSNNLLIRRSQDHNEYSRYTHRLLSSCLGLSSLELRDFEHHCRFYIVPLNELDQPNFDTMRRSFFMRGNNLMEHNIVKESAMYGLHQERGYSNKEQMFLVKKIHHDMNAMSRIPGMQGQNKTFLAAASKKFDGNVIEDINQPVVEVMAISTDLGSTKEGRRSRRDHETESRYYLIQFLDRFDVEAACAFQSYLLPILIYRLYITLTATELDAKFKHDTRDRRNRDIVPQKADEPMELIFDSTVEEVAPQDGNNIDVSRELCDAPGGEEEGDAEGWEEDGDEDMEAHYYADDFYDEIFYEDDMLTQDGNSIRSDDTDYDNDDIVVGPDYRDMLTKQCLDLKDHDDDDNLERWNMSEYSNPNMERQSFGKFYSQSETDLVPDTREISMLRDEMILFQHRVIERIHLFSKILTSDASFLDEVEEFQKRTAKVDHSIIPPIEFDRDAEPIRVGSRERGLIEALTQRKAGESYNLEGLENIGDSYLKYIVSVVLFKSLDGNEGFMTSARSRLTGNKYFCHLAKKAGLGSLAITSSFANQKDKHHLAFILGQFYPNRLDLKQFYNRMRPKSLADTFESIVGGYLVYQGEYEALMAMEWLGLKLFSDEMFAERHEKAIVFSKAPTARLDDNTTLNQNYYKSSAAKVRKFEEIIGYKFNDPSYLVQAFTHASTIVKCTRSYERLEFLGDAILDYMVTLTFAKTTRTNDPGQLTNSRSALVNNVAFAKLSMKYKFDLFIQHCNHELYDELSKVRLAMEDDSEMIFLDMIEFDRIVKLLGDVFESVAGAIYLDSGNSLDTVWRVYYPMMRDAIEAEIKTPSKNMTAALYESFPGESRITFETYDVKTEDGQLVGVRCRILCYDERTLHREFEGEGISKHQAKLRAINLAMANPPSEAARVRLNREFLDRHGTRPTSSSPAPRGERGRARGRGRGRFRGGGRGGGRGYRSGHYRR